MVVHRVYAFTESAQWRPESTIGGATERLVGPDLHQPRGGAELPGAVRQAIDPTG